MFEENKLTPTKEISAKKKLPQLRDKMIFTREDILLLNADEILSASGKKIFKSTDRKVVIDCCKKKKWSDFKKVINASVVNKISIFGVLLEDFDCKKNSDLKLFSNLNLHFPLLKILYRIDEKKYDKNEIQKLLNLGFDGLCFGEKTLSEKMNNSLKKLQFRNNEIIQKNDLIEFSQLRKEIDRIDDELFELLSQRNKAIKAIGEIKMKSDLKIFQTQRWKTILDESFEHAEKYGIDKKYLKKILETIHLDAIKTQLSIYSKKVGKKS